MPLTFDQTRVGYAAMWRKMGVRPERASQAQAIAAQLVASKGRYLSVSQTIGCPWWFVAIIHQLEGGGNFSTHLHNGDSLRARTRNVPAGRPKAGNPPFTWDESALDALRLKKVEQVRDWPIERALWEWEKYNGMGYFGKCNSPYLWSYSNLYASGKYVRDHVFSSTAVSAQCGAAVLLKFILEKEPDSMQELRDYLEPYAKLFPALANAFGGKLGELALTILAEEISAPDTVADVLAKLRTLRLTERTDALGKVEAALGQFSAHDAPVVAAEVKPAPALSPLDALFGGDRLKGYKTLIGIGAYVALKIALGVGIAPVLLTPGVVEMLTSVIFGWIGIGVAAKLDRPKVEG